MKLHSVIISYQRRDLTEQAITSYLATVTVPYTLTVVDNGSDPDTVGWLILNGLKHEVMLLGENRYPGFACNRGFEVAPADATHLHRADNDFAFLPGWCDEVARAFTSGKVGQVGLRTDAEEEYAKSNVGGNMVIRREVWDAGLHYDERPWPEIAAAVGPGYTEDSFLSPAVEDHGWRWTRVRRPCIVPLGSGDPDDPYYRQGYIDRGILPQAIRAHYPDRE